MAGASRETLTELREARRELSKLSKELSNFSANTGKKGSRAGRTWGKLFKTGAKFAAKNFFAGVFEGAGEAVMNRRAEKSGRTFSKRFKRSAKREMSAGGGLGGILSKQNLNTIGLIGMGALARWQWRNSKTDSKQQFRRRGWRYRLMH